MNNRILFMLLVAAVLLAGCVEENTTQKAAESQTTSSSTQETAPETSEPSTSSTSTIPESQTPEIKVEVYHFHPTSQCSSCRTLGEFAEKTVDTYYKDELESGVLVFAHVNAQLPENRRLVEKYGVSASSLWIGVYKDGVFHKEESVNVWYKLNNEADFMAYLKGVLDKRLAGDLS